MGIEYQIDPSTGTGAAWSALLEDMLQIATPTGELLEWRRTGVDGIPDAFIRINPKHIYFCANSTAGEALLTQVRQAVDREFGVTHVAEL